MAMDPNDPAQGIDVVNVTSTVVVNGSETIRTYSDGSVQRNTWETPEHAQAYASSVAAQGG